MESAKTGNDIAIKEEARPKPKEIWTRSRETVGEKPLGQKLGGRVSRYGSDSYIYGRNNRRGSLTRAVCGENEGNAPMYEYFKGRIARRTPTHSVVETHGVGYVFQHTLSTFEALSEGADAKVYVHMAVRDDAHALFGFHSEAEREMFRRLISVSGVGPSTSIALLSALQPSELRRAIMEGDVNTLKKIKGIGAKSAQRIIVDLRDRFGDEDVNFDNFAGQSNTARSEALRALQNLGFDRRKTEKIVDDVLKNSDESIGIEDLIKRSLKAL